MRSYGARVLVTLLNALRDRGLKRGLASLCLGAELSIEYPETKVPDIF